MKTDIKQFLRKDHTRSLFLAPALIFIALFILYPLLSSVVLALSDITFPRGVLTTKFSGFKNFAKILKQEIFWTCVKNTVVFVICRITGTFVMGLIVAMIVVRAKGIMSHILKTLFLVPWALSDVVNGTMWDWMYNGKYGIINEILLKLHLIDQYQPWLSMGKTALWAIIFADVWKSVPFVSLMYLAALTNVDRNLYEAAEIDGAGVVQRFFSVTIPSIKPIIVITTVIQSMWALKVFDLIWVLTKGGPANSTMTLAVLAYRESFMYTRIGSGAAIAYMLCLLTLIFIVSTLSLSRLGGNED